MAQKHRTAPDSACVVKNKVPRPSSPLNGYEAAALCAEGVGEAALGEYEPSIHLIS